MKIEDGGRVPLTLIDGTDTRLPEVMIPLVGYGVDGRDTGDEALAVAKRSSPGHVEHFFVKFSKSAGRLLDPRAIYYRPSDLADPAYEFRRVSRDVFDDYMNYLKRHDATFLRRAERAVRNG